jgi:hypothetical protein
VINPSNVEPGSVVLFTGATDIRDGRFEHEYMPDFHMVVKAGCEIRVGCGTGVDEKIQIACRDTKYENIKVNCILPLHHIFLLIFFFIFMLQWCNIATMA